MTSLEVCVLWTASLTTSLTTNTEHHDFCQRYNHLFKLSHKTWEYTASQELFLPMVPIFDPPCKLCGDIAISVLLEVLKLVQKI